MEIQLRPETGDRPDSATFVDEAGDRHCFTWDTTESAYRAPMGNYDELTKVGSDFKLTSKDRSYLTFDSTASS